MMTVLLVDDQLHLRSIHGAYLEMHGYRVLTADDGEAAITCARFHRPDIIFLDHSLPQRNGLEVARELKRDPDTAAIPILMLTGHSFGAVGAKALAAGCSAFLCKPCTPQRVLQEVQRYVG